jgi:hypothetical protein
MALTLTTSPATVQLAKNPVYVKFLSTSYSSLDNYRVVLRVLFENVYESTTYAQIVEAECIPDSNGESTFDLSGVLQKAMERTMAVQVPDFSNPTPYLADTLRRFKIQYLEKSGTPQEEQSATTSSAYKVLYGGVDMHYFGLYNFFSNLSATNSLLTYYPSGKIVAREQPEYLTYIQQATAISSHAFIRVVQYDNTGTLIGTFADYYRLNADYPDPIFIERYEACVFPTGPTALSLDTDCVKYTVQVFWVESISTPGGAEESGSATAASQLYTYYIDDSAQPLYTDLIWFGGFNTPHVLRCTGRKATRLDVQRQLSEQVVGFAADPTAMATLQHSRDWNNQYSYRSGAIRPEEKDAYQELVIENKLLEYAADGNYYRLRLTTNSLNVYEQETSPNYLEITAVRSLAPRNYMRLRSISVATSTENAWLLSDNGFWELGVMGGYWQL